MMRTSVGRLLRTALRAPTVRPALGPIAGALGMRVGQASAEGLHLRRSVCRGQGVVVRLRMR